MKSPLVAISLIILYTQHSFFAMDQAEKTIPQYDLLATIDTAVNKKHSANGYFADITNIFITPQLLTEEDMFNIVGIVAQYYPENQDDTLLDNLYKRNSFFAKTVDYFTTLAQKNLDNITADNLKIIENTKKDQPITQLNKLTPLIKQYAMQRALKKIDYTYDITLAGHKDDIRAFDICEATHQAATCSIGYTVNSDNAYHPFKNVLEANNNNSFYLWDLKTGKIIHTFDEKRAINSIAFSPDGVHIAAAMHDENAIGIWCPKTGQKLHMLNTVSTIESMQYTCPINHTLIVLQRKENNQPCIVQWTLATHNAIGGEFGSINYVGGGRQQETGFNGTHYSAYHPMFNAMAPKNTLYVTKKSIPLYLCTQAIKRTQNANSLPNSIERSSSYQALTDLEKPMVAEELRKKIAALKAMPQQRQPQTTRPLLTNK